MNEKQRFSWKNEVCLYGCRFKHSKNTTSKIALLNLENFNMVNDNVCLLCLDHLTNKSSIYVDLFCGHYICSKCFNISKRTFNYNNTVQVYGLNGLCDNCRIHIYNTNNPVYFTIINNNRGLCVNCYNQIIYENEEYCCNRNCLKYFYSILNF